MLPTTEWRRSRSIRAVGAPEARLVNWLNLLIAVPLLAFALWLRARPGRVGSNAELWGAPSDKDLIDAGLPPKDSAATTPGSPRRLFGPFPEEKGE